MKKYAVLTALVLLIFLLTACGCKHEWQPATCMEKQKCTLCGETQGEADGPHDPGDWVETADYILGEVEGTQYCRLCNAVTDTKKETLQTLVEGELYVLTPMMFVERMENLAREKGMSFETSIDYDQPDLWIFAHIDGCEVMLQFFHSDTSSMAVEEADSTGLWCVSINMVGEARQLGSLLDREICEVFFRAIDPMLDGSGMEEIWIAKGTAANNAANQGGFFEYYEKNGLIYEFGHVVYSSGEKGICVENIQIYASDWR